ncbi:hypothetical protein NP603_00275 [Methylomonas sp. SURF-1]|uniref:DUF2489 domain-containing protein n=1 Tax=Methylomonas aurea TaxID=2952224 RepID=A0ABT1UBD2_9GAMM|nr:hypothetical protein [Methylomonas sp. SURF-1]MCQ8179528.1 hypothetical protein [Methylomonas sp. SURF-1]
MPPLPDLVVGAFLALLGVLVSQLVAMIQARLEREHKRDVLLRTKYEELGAHFLESMKLPHTLMTAESTEDILALTHQASGNHAHLLAMIYFPRLRESTGKYIESYSQLCLAAAELHNPDDKRPLGMQVFDKPSYISARNAHIAARDFLQEQIERYADTYAKS